MVDSRATTPDCHRTSSSLRNQSESWEAAWTARGMCEEVKAAAGVTPSGQMARNALRH